MASTRRLTAILAADVAGYSRLMGEDEEGTHERLKALRRELVDPKIAEHRGRIVKNTGDGVLVEFASVVDAVRCAVEVQQAMPERNAPRAPAMTRAESAPPPGSCRRGPPALPRSRRLRCPSGRGGISSSRRFERRAYRGRIYGEYRARSPSAASRSRGPTAGVPGRYQS
jgi:hypothetical protein